MIDGVEPKSPWPILMKAFLSLSHRMYIAGTVANEEGRRMRWWTKALIYSVIWVGIVIAIGYVHTDVFLAAQITPAQDEAISDKYGEIAGFGVVWVWLACFLVFWWSRRRRTS
ncbi:MAG TPA: hypothetical protein VGI32_10240 [Steroidobacteraceae bacterium]